MEADHHNFRTIMSLDAIDRFEMRHCCLRHFTPLRWPGHVFCDSFFDNEGTHPRIDGHLLQAQVLAFEFFIFAVSETFRPLNLARYL